MIAVGEDATKREAILNALVARMAASEGYFPPAILDEPEPSQWEPVTDPIVPGMKMFHALAIQDGPPPDRLAYMRGAEGDATDELELEAVIAYGVRVELGAGQTMADVRSARRAQRDHAVKMIAQLIAQDRTLGLSDETWAEVAPAQRDDDVAFPNATAVATAIVPVRVLYTATHAAG